MSEVTKSLRVDDWLAMQPHLEAFLESGVTDPEAWAVAKIKELRLREQFLSVVGTVDPSSLAQLLAAPAAKIEGYELQSLISAGGMGSVWRARQYEPLERAVAVKLLRPSAHLMQLMLRFRVEQRALATLNHPAIAKVFDAGLTTEGQPFLALELVEGVPITTYADTKRLSIDRRLDLFKVVCEAVAYAHKQLVIHRDLKPQNILVTDEGDRPLPKIIDFGVAKLLDPLEAPLSALTEVGQLIGTPRYMSPERLSGATPSDDLRSDVWALGIVLCELLVGHHPVVVQESATIEEFRNAVMAGSLRPPSHTLAARTAHGDEIAERRDTTWSRLRRQITRDLDAVVLKALAAAPTERYQSADELAHDVHALRHGLPVQARAATLSYTVGRFIARHRAFAAASASMAAIVVGTVVVSVLERNRAIQEAQRAQEVNNFLIEVFEVNDPSLTPDHEISARDLLDRAAKRIEKELESDPVRRAVLMEALADSYTSLGEPGIAVDLYRSIVELRTENLGPEHPHLALAYTDLASAHLHLGHWAEGADCLKRALRIQERHEGLEHPDTATTINNLGAAHYYLGDLKAAEAHYLQALDIRLKVLGENNLDTAGTLNNLAVLYRKTGRLEESAAVHRRALAIKQNTLDPDHPSIATSLNALASTYRSLGRLDESIGLRNEALTLNRRVFGDENPVPARTRTDLAIALAESGDLLGAEEHQRHALTVLENSYPDPHPEIALGMSNLAMVLTDRGYRDEPETLLRRALVMRQRLYEHDHEAISDSLHALGLHLLRLGNWTESSSLLLRALAVRKQHFGSTHESVASTLSALAYLHFQQGDQVNARRHFQEVLHMRRSLVGDDHPFVSRTLVQLADLEVEDDHLELAESYFHTGLGGLRRANRTRSLDYLLGQLALANLYVLKDRVATAEQLVDNAANDLRQQVLPTHSALAVAKSTKGACLASKGLFLKAEALLLQSHADLVSQMGTKGVETKRAVERIIELYDAWQKPALANDWRTNVGP